MSPLVADFVAKGGDGHAQAAQAARQLLTEMADLLDRMHDDLAQAKDRLESRHAR